MRFLVVTKSNGSPIPPEAAIGIFEAMSRWHNDLATKGKMEQGWGFAGGKGGGGILNVESLDELDELVSSMPLGPFSNTEILGLVDMETTLSRAKDAFRALMPPTR